MVGTGQGARVGGCGLGARRWGGLGGVQVVASGRGRKGPGRDGVQAVCQAGAEKTVAQPLVHVMGHRGARREARGTAARRCTTALWPTRPRTLWVAHQGMDAVGGLTQRRAPREAAPHQATDTVGGLTAAAQLVRPWHCGTPRHAPLMGHRCGTTEANARRRCCHPLLMQLCGVLLHASGELMMHGTGRALAAVAVFAALQRVGQVPHRLRPGQARHLSWQDPLLRQRHRPLLPGAPCFHDCVARCSLDRSCWVHFPFRHKLHIHLRPAGPSFCHKQHTPLACKSLFVVNHVNTFHNALTTHIPNQRIPFRLPRPLSPHQHIPLRPPHPHATPTVALNGRITLSGTICSARRNSPPGRLVLPFLAQGAAPVPFPPESGPATMCVCVATWRLQWIGGSPPQVGRSYGGPCCGLQNAKERRWRLQWISGSPRISGHSATV